MNTKIKRMKREETAGNREQIDKVERHRKTDRAKKRQMGEKRGQDGKGSKIEGAI